MAQPISHYRTALLLLGLLLAPLTSSLRGDEAADQYNVASGFYRMDRFEFAAEEYEKYLKDFPKHEQVPEALFFLGESYYHLNKLDLAREKYRDVVARFPSARNYHYALYRIGESSSVLSDFKAAEPPLQEFVVKRADDALIEFALPHLGRAYLKNGKPAESKAALLGALEKFPKGKLADQCRFDLAGAHEQLGEKEQATRLYQALADDSASKFADDALLALGTRHFDDKNYELAVAKFQELEQRFPASPWVAASKLNRALCLYQLQKYAESQQILEAQVQGESKNVPEAWYWLGMAQKAGGRLDKAAKTLLDSYAMFGSSPVAAEMLFYAAQSLLQQTQYEPALGQFQEFLKRYPKHELADDALYLAAESARLAGQHDRAFNLSTQFFKDFPQSPLTGRLTLTVGQSLIAMGRHEEAAKYLAAQTVRSLSPELALSGQYYRAVALHAAGQLDEAIATLEPLLQPAAQPDATSRQIIVDAHFLAGSCLFEKKEYARAVAVLQKYLASQPTGEVAGHAASTLALSLSALGRTEELRTTLVALRGSATKDLLMPALFRVAESCFDGRQYEVAAELYAEVAEKDPAGPLHARALSGLGWARFQDAKYAQAAEAFGQLVTDHAADPLAAEACYLRGRSLEADKKLEAAVAAYRAVLDNYPQSTNACDAGLQAARLLQKTGKAGEAIALYSELPRRFPQAKQLDVVLYEWAWALQQGGQPAEAQKIFDQLTAQFPNSPLMSDAAVNASETLYQSKQYAEVLARLKPLLTKEISPQARGAALYRLGRTQSELAAWPEAAAAFQQLVKEFPASALRREAEFWTAEAERQQGQYKAAVDRLNRLIAEPVPAETWLGTAHLRLAQTLGEQKQWKEMLSAIEQLKKQFPKYELMNVADYHAGRALQSLARFDEARESYRRGIAGRTDENAAQCQFMIGEAFFHQKRYQEAIREFLKVEILYAFPQWQAGALLEVGKCHESLQEWSRAAETYNRILEKYPKTTHVQEAAQRRAAVMQKLTAGTSKE